MNGGDSSSSSFTSPATARLYEALVDRCERLETSHVGLKKQFKSLLQEKSSANYQINDDNDRRRNSMVEMMTSDSGEKSGYVNGGAYRNVLHCMGHAVYVTRPASGEIIFWNNAAEKLFGYKGSDLNGQKFTVLHIDEEYMLIAKKIMERLRCGECWSGQFPFKKKTGEIFMALVTQSPLYEDSEFVGIITVSSDAAVFNSQDDHDLQQPSLDHGVNGQDDRHYLLRGLNIKRIQWANRPQITSSVNDLASKVLLRKGGDSKCNEDRELENEFENPEIKSDRPPRVPARRQIFQFAKSFTGNRRVERDGILKREREFLQSA